MRLQFHGLGRWRRGALGRGDNGSAVAERAPHTPRHPERAEHEAGSDGERGERAPRDPESSGAAAHVKDAAQLDEQVGVPRDRLRQLAHAQLTVVRAQEGFGVRAEEVGVGAHVSTGEYRARQLAEFVALESLE